MILRLEESACDACPCCPDCASASGMAELAATAPSTEVFTKSRRETVTESSLKLPRFDLLLGRTFPASRIVSERQEFGARRAEGYHELCGRFTRIYGIGTAEGGCPHMCNYLLAKRRNRPGYSAPASSSRFAADSLMGCTFSDRKRSSAAIFPTASNSGSSLT